MTKPLVPPDEGGEAPCFAHLFDEPPTVPDAIVVAGDVETDVRAGADATAVGDDADEARRPAPGDRGRPADR